MPHGSQNLDPLSDQNIRFFRPLIALSNPMTFGVVCSLSQFVLKTNVPGQCQNIKKNVDSRISICTAAMHVLECSISTCTVAIHESRNSTCTVAIHESEEDQ